MPKTLTMARNKIEFQVKIALTAFYAMYTIALILGLFLNSSLGGLGRAYFLQAIRFNARAVWSYSHLLSLAVLVALIVFFFLTKKIKDLFRKEMIYLFGAYLILSGLTSLFITFTGGYRLEYIGLGALIFGSLLIITQYLNDEQKITNTKKNLLRGIGAFSYFLGIIVANHRILFILSGASPNALLFRVFRGAGGTKTFYPTFPNWILGGTLWLFVSFYLCLDFLEEKQVIKQTESTKRVLRLTIASIYAIELLLFGIFLVGFGFMQGVCIILMFIGSMIGIVAALGVGILILIELGLLKTAEQELKEKEEYDQLEPSHIPSESETETTKSTQEY